MNKNNVIGVVLSGGLSKRMGEDKSEKKINGKSLIELVLKRSEEQVAKIIINSNKEKNLFLRLGYKNIIKDCIDGNLGPLVGILSGLKWVEKNSNNKWLVCFPVDSPFFPKNLVSKFLEESKDYEILMAKSLGRVHPVFSMWKVNSNMAIELEKFLMNNQRKIDAFTKNFKTRVVNFPDIGYDPFFNVNTPDDLLKAETIYEKNIRNIE